MTTRLMYRTERLVAIEQLLFHSKSGMRAVELAEACGVDRRTVYRDLSLLNEIGVSIYQKDGRFYLDREHYLANVRLNYDELMALLLCASAMSRQGMSPHLVTALQKLSRSLPQPVRAHANRLIEIAQRNKLPDISVEALDTLARAWGDMKKVKIWYESRDGSKVRKREVSTYLIEPKFPGGIYVIGYDSLTKKVRAFQLSRIRRAQVLESRYEIPSHFDVRRYVLYGQEENRSDEAGRSKYNFSNPT
ncbi:MAG TPA: WYL domain-containing protein [Oceanobacillus sp.]|nr:WYL domain-containing protein [Oceanobacillus sp.]